MMNATPAPIDELHLGTEKGITKQFEADEKILISCMVHKFNKRMKRQERGLMISNKYIYNLSKTTIKRKIAISKVTAITVSKMSCEFVLHCPEEYDYRYSSAEKRDQLLEIITKAWLVITGKKIGLPYFYKDDLNLTNWTTTKADKKKNISRVPTDKPILLNEESFMKNKEGNDKQKANERSRTSTLYAKDKAKMNISIDDFNLVKVLGRGAFGKVMLVEKKDTKEIFAIKSLRKEELIDKEQIEHTKTEKVILETVNHPFLVGLEWAFQTPEKIFFVMHFMRGGELFQHLKNSKRFPEKRAKFYVATICSAIGHLHSKDIIYRDLKPENILMDENGYVYLTDFGMAKFLKKDTLAMSFCGTPEYLSPEIITGEGHAKEADWWSIGILAYETLYGIPPFYHQNQSTMYELIKDAKLKFPASPEVSEEGKDFIKSLLVREPKRRLGTSKDFEDIKNHKWFKDLDWDALHIKKLEAPFKPDTKGDNWVDNFDEEFTKEDPMNSYVGTDQGLLARYSKEFADFGK
jgi:serum/glucocorticoid-regulated kinase 2